jgi:hypothetical protein
MSDQRLVFMILQHVALSSDLIDTSLSTGASNTGNTGTLETLQPVLDFEINIVWFMGMSFILRRLAKIV